MNVLPEKQEAFQFAGDLAELLHAAGFVRIRVCPPRTLADGRVRVRVVWRRRCGHRTETVRVLTALPPPA